MKQRVSLKAVFNFILIFQYLYKISSGCPTLNILNLNSCKTKVLNFVILQTRGSRDVVQWPEG